MLILKSLGRGALHGYAIAERIRELSRGVIKVEEGSLYPALHRMESRGAIAADWGLSENNRRAKFYRLTREGKRHLLDEQANWSTMSTAISHVMKG